MCHQILLLVRSIHYHLALDARECPVQTQSEGSSFHNAYDVSVSGWDLVATIQLIGESAGSTVIASHLEIVRKSLIRIRALT